MVWTSKMLVRCTETPSDGDKTSSDEVCPWPEAGRDDEEKRKSDELGSSDSCSKR